MWRGDCCGRKGGEVVRAVWVAPVHVFWCVCGNHLVLLVLLVLLLLLLFLYSNSVWEKKKRRENDGLIETPYNHCTPTTLHGVPATRMRALRHVDTDPFQH